MFLSAVSVLVVAQSSSEIPEGLRNNPVLVLIIPLNKEFRIETEDLLRRCTYYDTWAFRELQPDRQRDRELRRVSISKGNKFSKSRKAHFPLISANCTKLPRKVTHAYLMKKDVSSLRHAIFMSHLVNKSNFVQNSV